MLIRSVFAVFALALVGCATEATHSVTPDAGGPDGAIPDGGMPPEPTLVVDTDWLKANLGDSNVQLVDTRASGYDESRIPGAIHLRPATLATEVDGVPSQVAPPMQAEQVLRAAGLRNDVTAVVYGEPLEYDSSRIVWTLRYYGHGDVRYLDGGYDAWVGAAGLLDTDPPSVESTEYSIVGVVQELRVTGDWVLSQLGDEPYDMPTIQLVDARGQGEYDRGHIPSARSVNWTRNLGDGLLRSTTQLEGLYAGMDPATITVTYCVSGWRGSFAWLTLTALGYDDVRLYDGSWNEWGGGGFPVETPE